MDGIKLQEFAEVLANLLFDMASPPIGGETVGAIGLSVDGDVIRTFEPDDEVAFEFAFVVAARIGLFEEGQAHLDYGRAQGCHVFDLCFDGGEVTHIVLG